MEKVLHTPPDNKINVIFIINGSPTPFEINVNAPLHVAVSQVLKATGNDTKPLEKWTLKLGDVELDMNKKAEDYGIKDGAKLNLSSDAGIGG